MRANITHSISNATAWMVGLFPARKKNLENQVLDICPSSFCLETDVVGIDLSTLEFKENDRTLYRFLFENQYKHYGFTQVRLNNFNFTGHHTSSLDEEALMRLLKIVSSDIVLREAHLSVNQVAFLLCNNVDLSQSTYHVAAPISVARYFGLYNHCKQNNTLASLHDLRVDFSEEDLSERSDDFVSVCRSVSLTDSIISQNQFNMLLEKVREFGGLNLSGVVLSGIDIYFLLDRYFDLIDFDPRPYQRGEKRICLHNTPIYNATIDLQMIAKMAPYQQYACWFNSTICTFKLSFDVGLETIEKQLKVKEIIGVVVEKINRSSAGLLKNFFAKTIVDILSNEKEKVKSTDPVLALCDFKKMSQGEHFMWVCYLAEKHPESIVSKVFWSIVHPFDLCAHLDPRGL